MICRSIHSDLEVVIKVRSYFVLPNGEPKKYYQRKTLPPLVVDKHKCGILQLVDHIGETFEWGSKQYITLWRSLEDVSIEIKTDEHLLEWFELNFEKGVVHIDAQINDFNGPLQFSPTKHRCHPKVRKRVLETPSTPPLDMDPPVDPTQPTQDMTNSTNERATNTNERTTNEEEILPDEEAIGVDEEGNYSDTESVRALSDSSYNTDLAASSESEYDPTEEIVDEVDEDDIPVFSYDVDDPCIDVNVVFSDTDQCKSAVTHHCILNDHAFHIVKKDKKRFRAICKRAKEGCKWEFYASTSPKYIGCKVTSVAIILL